MSKNDEYVRNLAARNRASSARRSARSRRTRVADDRMNARVWYHGTDARSVEKLQKGVRIDINKETELDFGYGFYLTSSLDEAINFISEWKKQMETFGTEQPDPDHHPVVVEFELPQTPQEIQKAGTYKMRVFGDEDPEFFEFIFFNREENAYGDKQHIYDFVYGDMSNSNPIRLIAEYRIGEKTKQEVIQEIGIFDGFKQLSIHNQGFCDKLKIRKVYDAETRKELSLS